MSGQWTVCKLCNLALGDEVATVSLTQKGCDSNNNARKLRGNSLKVTPSDVVHISCRKRYCAIPDKSFVQRDDANMPSSSSTNLRSNVPKFD